MTFRVDTARDYTQGEWFVSDGQYIGTAKVDGLSVQNKLAGELTSITVSGANDQQSGLDAGKEYFLENKTKGS